MKIQIKNGSKVQIPKYEGALEITLASSNPVSGIEIIWPDNFRAAQIKLTAEQKITGIKNSGIPLSDGFKELGSGADTSYVFCHLTPCYLHTGSNAGVEYWRKREKRNLTLRQCIASAITGGLIAWLIMFLLHMS